MRTCLTVVLLNVITIITVLVSQAYSQERGQQPSQGNDRVADQWVIRFDISPVTRLVLHSDDVIKDTKVFWQTDSAYQLVRSWHEWNDIAIPMRTWKASIRAYADMPAAQREQSRAMLVSRELLEQKDRFLREAVPHICSFLPDLPTNVTTNVYFTAETVPRAIAVGDNIVLDVTHDYWQGSASTILNCAVHEAFHVGYGWNVCAQTESPLANAGVYAQVSTLQNEGLATYVAYAAQHIFPAPAEDDYRMLDNPSAVKRARRLIKRLFQKAESVSPDRFRQDAWRIGVEQRAFYVLGAHMGKTIDERLGREALADTIACGPRSFVRKYNNLVDEDMRVFEFEPPEVVHWSHKLRVAASKRDYDAVRQIQKARTQRDSAADSGTQETILCAGRLLIRQKELDLAIEVLSLTTELFPEFSGGHYFLGEAWLKRGDTGRALACYGRTLELEPSHLYAASRVKRLKSAADTDPE